MLIGRLGTITIAEINLKEIKVEKYNKSNIL